MSAVTLLRVDLESLNRDDATFTGPIDTGNGRSEWVTLTIPAMTWVAMDRPLILTVTAVPDPVAEPPPS